MIMYKINLRKIRKHCAATQTDSIVELHEANNYQSLPSYMVEKRAARHNISAAKHHIAASLTPLAALPCDRVLPQRPPEQLRLSKPYVVSLFGLTLQFLS